MPRIRSDAGFWKRTPGVGTICTIYTRAHFALPRAHRFCTLGSLVEFTSLVSPEKTCESTKEGGVGSLICVEHEIHLTGAAMPSAP